MSEIVEPTTPTDDTAASPEASSEASRSASMASRSRWRRFRAWARSDRAGAAALGFLAVLALVMIFAPLISRHDPTAQEVTNMLSGPSASNWLGTDDLGRDVFARLLFGARWSILASLLAVGVALGIGVPIGLATGFIGGRLDDVIMRIVDTLMSFPAIILAIAVIAALGPGITNAMIAVGIVLSPIFARLMRGQVMAVKEELYVDAARSFGARDREIIGRHIVPNAIQPIIVQASLLVAVALIAEASLSFLGMGVQPPDSSWGFLLGRAYRNMHDAPFQMVPPGIAIVLTVLAFNLLGDSLRTLLDPTTRHRRR